MCGGLATVKDSSAAVTSRSGPQTAGPAAHIRRLRHVFGLTATGSSVSDTPRAPAPPGTPNRQTWPGRPSRRRSLSSSQSSPPTQDPASQTRLLAPDPPARPEPARPRPPLSLPRPPSHRSSKTSLGFISTPLIWQGRKRPTGGRRPTATRAPSGPVVHITKPAALPTELKHTARPAYTTQEGGFRHTTAAAQPTSGLNFSHQLTTTQHSKPPPESRVSVSSPGKHIEEDAKAPPASSSSLLSSSSALSNRKNKPVAPQWSLLSTSENQTDPRINWTDPLETQSNEYSSGPEAFVYDLTELSEEGSAFSLYEFDAVYSLDAPATPGPDAPNQQSINQSDPRGASLPLTPSEGSEVLRDLETPADRDPSPTHSQDRLMSGTVGLISRSQTPQTHHSSSTGQKQEDSFHIQAVTQKLETFKPAPSLLTPPRSSLLLMQPTPSFLTVHLSSSASLAEIFPKQAFSSLQPQKAEQISYSSLSVTPLDSVHETDITGSRLIINVYTSTDISPKTSSSNVFRFPLDIHLSSSASLLTPFTYSHTITPSASSSVTLTSQTPTWPRLSSSPLLWSSTIPLPPSTRPSSPQQVEQRPSDTGGVVESGHVSESGGVSRNLQPSLLSSLPLSSNLQRDFVVTRVDTASSVSPPLFSKASHESQMPVVDGVPLAEYHLLSAEESSNNMSEPFRSRLPYIEGNQPPDTHSGLFVSQIKPSGLSAENLASSTDVLALSQLGSSEVLWPSSHATILSVSQFLVHSDQRELSDIDTRSDESRPENHPAVGFTSMTAAGIWASECTPALLQAESDQTQPSISSSPSNTFPSASALFSHHPENLSVTLSTETPPAATVIQAARTTERMVEQETAVSSSSFSPNPIVENSTSSSGLLDRRASSLTFNGDPWRLPHTLSHLDTDNQLNTNSRGSQALVDHGDAFNHPTSPSSNPSVMVTTQTPALHSSQSAQLGTDAPRHASGLDYMYQSVLEQTNTEHTGHLTDTRGSEHTHLGTQVDAGTFLDAGETLNMSQRPDVDFRGQFMSFAGTPPLLSPSLSAAETQTPPFPAISPYITVSSLPPLPVVSASIEEAQFVSLSPSWLISEFQRPTTTQSPLENHLQSLQRSTTYPVRQSVQQFITVSRSLLLNQSFTRHSAALVSDKDELLPELVNASQTGFIPGPVLSPEASNNLTTAAKLVHLSAAFDPADVVPKIHEQASAEDGNTTLNEMLNAPTGHQVNLNPEAALHTQPFPVEMQTTSSCPTSAPVYQQSSAASPQPTGAPVIQAPLHISGLNIPSSTPVSGPPTSSSIGAPGQGFISANTAGFKNISMSNATTVTAPKDSPSVQSERTKAEDVTAFIENGRMEAPEGNETGSKPTSDLSETAGTSAKPSLNSSPSLSNHSGSQNSGVLKNPEQSDDEVKETQLSSASPVVLNAHHFTTTKSTSPSAPFRAVGTSASSLKKASVRPTSGPPTVDLAAEPALPCQCKQRFHFTCLCGVSSGNSMSCSNKRNCSCREPKQIICGMHWTDSNSS